MMEMEILLLIVRILSGVNSEANCSEGEELISENGKYHYNLGLIFHAEPYVTLTHKKGGK